MSDNEKFDVIKELAKMAELERQKKEWQSGGGARDLVSPNVIPTMYKGIKFRSRLEARWAVFFDTLGIEWEYEPQGYEIGCSYTPMPGDMIYTFSDGSTGDTWHKKLKESEGLTVVSEKPATGDESLEWYLPDFWLPELKIWVEVKGVFGDSELLTTVRAIDGFSMGLPNIRDIDEGDPTGILYLGDIPNPERNRGTGSHIMFTRHKGVQDRVARFRFNAIEERVEVEVGAIYSDWYLDVTCMYEDTIESYRDENNYRRIVKGLPRDYKERIDPRWSEYAWVSKRQTWPSTKYPALNDDSFGEAVIRAGWDAARNAQF